ncbi:type II secretion system F family protein [Alicyclobacillus tolerans]
MPIFLGVLLFLAVLLALLGPLIRREERVNFWKKQIQRDPPKVVQVRRAPKGFLEQVQFYADALGETSWPSLFPRYALFSAGVVELFFVLIGQPFLGLPVSLMGLSVPYFWMRGRYQTARITLKQQMQRLFLFLAHLVKAGASLEVALRQAAQAFEYPLRPYLIDAVATIGKGERGQIQLDTAATALLTMAERMQLKEAERLAQIVSQTQLYDTNLGDVLLEMVSIDLRDKAVQSEATLDKLSSSMEMIGQLMVSTPLYLYIMLAVFGYVGKYLATLHV